MIELLAALALGPVEVDGVPVEYVSADHWVWPAGRSEVVARAVGFADGSRVIFVNKDNDLTDLQGWLGHERAHFDAWDRYGTRIRVHGSQWKRACRKRVTRRQSYFCKGL